MAHHNIIIELRNYLKKWFLASEAPKLFMGEEILEKNPNEILFHLGKFIYTQLTETPYQGLLDHPAVIKPRLYQFLSTVLSENSNDHIHEPEILLQLLTVEERDTIELHIEKENYSIECYSTLGVTRLKNQDYLSAFELENGTVVLMVADGMGGGDAGEVASKLVIDSLTSYLQNLILDPSIIEAQLRNGVFTAHQKLLEHAKDHHYKSMGTTLSMSLILPEGELYIVHVGDSRIYEMEQLGELRQLSEDHSYPEVLFRLGKITEEEKINYQKNIVVYILGKERLKKEEICTYQSFLYRDTELFLCSDGFWDMLPVNRETFSKPFEALKKDIFQQISKDNVTLIRYKPKKSLIDVTTKVSKNGKY